MQGREMTWANPATAGIVGLCCSVIPLAALNLGWIAPEGAPLIIAWLLFGGLVQVICGLIEFKRGGLLFATPLLVFGLMLCITPAVGELIKIWIGNFTVPATVSGVGFLVVAVYVIALFIASGLVSKLFFVLLIILDCGLWLVGLADVGAIGRGPQVVGWLLLLFFAIGMLYASCALFLNEMFGKPLLPLGEPLFKPASNNQAAPPA
ncbi:MAG: hypothetical protein WCY82_00745 [Desulfotomaculaceae bacterium]